MSDDKITATVDDDRPLSRQQKDLALDTLCLIASASRSDEASFTAMMNTFQPDEYQALIAAVIGHAVSILRLASETIGVEPAKILGGVRASLNGDPS